MDESLIFNTIVGIVEVGLPERLIEAVLRRLEYFGCAVTSADCFEVSFAIQKIESHIKNECNIAEIPEELFEVAVDMVCGEYMYTKYNLGTLNTGDLNLDGIVSSVKLGDTNVNFDTSTTDKGVVSTLIDHLRNDGKGDLICFRKIRW